MHLAEEHRWGLGVAAFEVGSGYTRQEPLQRIARRLLADLADRTRQSAHLAVLHGRDVLYVVEERAPGPASARHRCRRTTPRPPDRERPGDPRRAARRPGARAVPGRRCLRRAARLRPAHPQPAAGPAHRHPAARVRDRGGRGDPGLASVASAVLDHNGHPVAAWPSPTPTVRPRALADAVRRTAAALTRRLRWTARALTHDGSPASNPGYRGRLSDPPDLFCREGMLEASSARAARRPRGLTAASGSAAATVSSDTPANSSSSLSRTATIEADSGSPKARGTTASAAKASIASRSDAGAARSPGSQLRLGQRGRVDVDRVRERGARR